MSSSVPGTPRTPTTTKKKLTTRGLNAPKSVGGTPRPTHPSMVSPRPSLPSANWERKKTPLLVYEHAKSITNVPGKLQGVWQCGYQATVSPTELWIFRTEDAPAGLEGSKHIHGYWGLDPDALDPGDPLPDDLSTIDPLRLWVYSPQATVPKFFTPRGVWTYPLIKRDISHLSPEQAGFLHVTDSVKTHKLDVPGSWKMLYRRDGLPEVPIGPGMSPRKNIVKPITVIVETPSGEQIPIDKVLPTDTLDKLKKKIEAKEGTPMEDQRLAKNGVPLKGDPTQTLKKLGIHNQDVLTLQGITVHVKPFRGPILTFENLDPRNTTLDQLQDRIDVLPKPMQRLFFEGEPLTNPTASLHDCGIIHESTLTLEPMEITIQTPQGESIQLQVDPNDTVKDIKQKLADEHDIPVDEQRLEFQGKPLKDHDTPAELGIKHGDTIQMTPMEVTVRDAKGKEFSVEVQPDDTVEDLKARIEDQEQIPKAEQRLAFEGKPLSKDKKSLKSYGIQHGSMLDLEPMTISVETPTGEHVDVPFSPNDTIADIKNKLEELHGIPVKDQRLAFKDNELSDQSTLKDNGIQHGDTLKVISDMQIIVKDWRNKSIPFVVTPSDTIASIRKRIQQIKDMDPEKQILTFEDTPLDDNEKSLADYNITNGSTIQLDRFKIYVECPSHGKFLMEVEPHWKIKVLQQSVEARFKVKMDQQEPTFHGFKGKLLPNSTIEACGIQHKDTVVVKEINIPKYDVHMGAWQDPFHYSPKSPLKKKVGVRRATTHDTSKDNFVASQRETALTADIWSKLQGKDSKEPK